jgi:hypothetical protein
LICKKPMLTSSSLLRKKVLLFGDIHSSSLLIHTHRNRLERSSLLRFCPPVCSRPPAHRCNYQVIQSVVVVLSTSKRVLRPAVISPISTSFCCDLKKWLQIMETYGHVVFLTAIVTFFQLRRRVAHVPCDHAH